jgi:hypothetical protein
MEKYAVNQQVKIINGAMALILWVLVAVYIGFFVYLIATMSKLAYVLNDIRSYRPDLDYLVMLQNADPAKAKMFYSVTGMFIIFILSMSAAPALFLAMAVFGTNSFIRAFDEITISGEELWYSTARRKSVFPKKTFKEFTEKKVFLFVKNPCLVFDVAGKTHDVSLRVFSEDQRGKIVKNLKK